MVNSNNKCPFCNITKNKVLKRSTYFLYIEPTSKLNKDHSLIIPRRHLTDWRQLNTKEQQSFFKFLKTVTGKTESYNLFTNIGKPAGQQVDHIHFHLTPRRKGDKSPFKKIT